MKGLILTIYLLTLIAFHGSNSRMLAQPKLREETKEYQRLFTGGTLGDARDLLKNHKFKDSEIRDIIVDSRKLYNAVLFRVRSKGGNVIALDIYVSRPRETQVELKKTLSAPNEDLEVLKKRLKL